MNIRFPLIKPQIGEEELSAIKEVLQSGYLTEGTATKAFEDAFAKYCGVEDAVAFTSCTTGLETALRALGIGKGDEVIIPNYTHPATAQAVYLVGAEPVLVDIDPKTYNIDYDEIEKAITPQTKVIMPVSLFGNPLDYILLNALKKKHDLFIVEDAACSAGACLGEKKVGSFADITSFSFHPRKVITTGEGGMNTTNNNVLAKKMHSFKRFGMHVDKGKIVFTEKIATNYKMSNVNAALGLAQLQKIENIIGKRRELAKKYDSLLLNSQLISSPFVLDNARHTYQSYVVLLEKKGIRDKTIHKLRDKGIETQIGSYALSLEPAFLTTKRIGKLQESLDIFENTLTLPLFSDLTFEDQKFIINTLTQTIRELDGGVHDAM